MIAHEAPLTAGFAGEISSTIQVSLYNCHNNYYKEFARSLLDRSCIGLIVTGIVKI